MPQIMLVVCQMVYVSTPYLERGNIEMMRTKSSSSKPYPKKKRKRKTAVASRKKGAQFGVETAFTANI